MAKKSPYNVTLEDLKWNTKDLRSSLISFYLSVKKKTQPIGFHSHNGARSPQRQGRLVRTSPLPLSSGESPNLGLLPVNTPAPTSCFWAEGGEGAVICFLFLVFLKGGVLLVCFL